MTKPISSISIDPDSDQPMSVSITPVTDHKKIAARWQALELRSDRSFFISWNWIEAWLESLDTPPFLAAISTTDGTDIALGLFCRHQETRHGVINVRQLILHATGNLRHDAITIEYNNLLCARGFKDAAWSMLISHLKKINTPKWDELIVPGATSDVEKMTASLLPKSYRRAEAGSSFVDLTALRRAGVENRDGFIATLSKNKRSQIRRSLKLYAERGPLLLERAQTHEQALEYFDAMGTLHDAKWRARGETSSISNPVYIAFHKQLLNSCFAKGQVELVRARAGEHIFGWVYNFIDRGNVLFYLSGFVEEEDNKLKPGLTTHILAIEDHLAHGRNIYDFMGGDAPYKKSLGEDGPQIVSYALQKPGPALMLEAAGRRLKNQLSNKG